MSDLWVHRLSDYVDGELADAERRELERHLTGCEHCQAVHRDLRRIVAEAGALENRLPSRDLWAGIASAIGGEGLADLEDPGKAAPADETTQERTVTPVERSARARPRRTLSLSFPQLLAASLALMLVSGGMGWLLRSSTGPEPTEPVPVADADPEITAPQQSGTAQVASVPPREESPPTLAEAMIGLEKRIGELQRAFVQYGESLDPETLAVLQDNLYFLDRAIFEAREALAQEPESEYLNAHLADSMMRKVRFLQQATAIAGTEI